MVCIISLVKLQSYIDIFINKHYLTRSLVIVNLNWLRVVTKEGKYTPVVSTKDCLTVDFMISYSFLINIYIMELSPV